jgi:hypothetical protein
MPIRLPRPETLQARRISEDSVSEEHRMEVQGIGSNLRRKRERGAKTQTQKDEEKR